MFRSAVPALIAVAFHQLLVFAAEPAKPPVYLWYEPEWFDGVEGNFAYWTGTAKPTGKWGIAGPGISPEWSQGGESEWNSMGVAAEETKASCGREIVIPRAGSYKLWVRYFDHRDKTEPFTIRIEQNGKASITAEFGVQPVVPRNDEYQLYWGFSFGWASADAKLDAGPAKIQVVIDKPGQAWRQVDAILITDDLRYQPVGREKPPFGYVSVFRSTGIPEGIRGDWQGTVETIPMKPVGGFPINDGFGRRPLKFPVFDPPAKRHAIAGRDFSMWVGADPDPKWWGKQKLDALSLYDVNFQFTPPQDIRDKFHKQFDGKTNVPLLGWSKLLPGFYLGSSPDLSPDSPARQWLERTKTPFYIMTNYASPTYTDKTGPATYQALTGPLANQFMGYIHGEAVGTSGLTLPLKQAGESRRSHVDAIIKDLPRRQAEHWSKFYKTAVPREHMAKSISCLSVDSIALAHAFHEMGCDVVGYEEDATNVHVPMRIAFERGAARQYGGGWLNYASGNFGDACNYFTQNPVVNRGAGGWFHSKYAVTDGVSIAWYRKMYYLNYLSGASAIYWEQSLHNQWILPGPGTHPIQLSPYGRATEEFQSFVDRLPDRGEPVTPIAFLLSYGHGYERVNNDCKMLKYFSENVHDRELRELFNVAWHPAGVVEGKPAMPDVQSMPSGVFGNIFDVLVDRPERAKAILNYPVIWAAGEVDLNEKWLPVLEEYLNAGGTLVINAEAARRKLPDRVTGFALSGTFDTVDCWQPDGGEVHAAVPYRIERGQLQGARVIAWAKPEVPLVTVNQVGKGKVILTLVPQILGLDERAHPALPYLMKSLTTALLPISIRIQRDVQEPNNRQAVDEPDGEIMYQINRTKDGYLIMLMNNRGIDKTQNGIARVDRTALVDVVLWTPLSIKSAKEYTQPRDLKIDSLSDNLREIRVRVHPGDVQVIGLMR